MLPVTQRQTSNVVCSCRFIADTHQVQFQVQECSQVSFVQKNGPAYIQDFKDLLTH